VPFSSGDTESAEVSPAFQNLEFASPFTAHPASLATRIEAVAKKLYMTAREASCGDSTSSH